MEPVPRHEFDEWQIDLHGHRVIYRTAGSGPPVVLIHGMVNSSRHWEQVALRLADRYTVIARALRPLEQPGAREAFLQTLRSVIDIRGQRVSAVDRLYLAADIPTLIGWGERDRTIPIEHGRAAQAAIPGSRFQTLPRAAHFPHLEDPEGLSEALGEFIATTRPGQVDDSNWGAKLKPRAPRSQRLRSAAA